MSKAAVSLLQIVAKQLSDIFCFMGCGVTKRLLEQRVRGDRTNAHQGQLEPDRGSLNPWGVQVEVRQIKKNAPNKAVSPVVVTLWSCHKRPLLTLDQSNDLLLSHFFILPHWWKVLRSESMKRNDQRLITRRSPSHVTVIKSRQRSGQRNVLVLRGGGGVAPPFEEPSPLEQNRLLNINPAGCEDKHPPAASAVCM